MFTIPLGDFIKRTQNKMKMKLITMQSQMADLEDMDDSDREEDDEVEDSDDSGGMLRVPGAINELEMEEQEEGFRRFKTSTTQNLSLGFVNFEVVPKSNIEDMETILQPQYAEEKRGRTNLQREIDVPDKKYGDACFNFA